MNKQLSNHIGDLLIIVGNKIKAETSEITEEEAIEIMRTIAKEPISREEVCKEFKISNHKFYELIDNGIIPKGKKRRGFKELIWYKDEIKTAISNIKI